jgi:3-phosphoshikimate 1-carboxyvinyltransferase
MTALAARPGGPLVGDIAVPGDKSISHRSLLIGSMAVGTTEIRGLLEGEDVHRTGAALSALGAGIERLPTGVWRVRGVGVGGLAEPEDVLDLGNSGTSARLLMGLLATNPLSAHMTGDASLRRRPMARVAAPLERMGATVIARAGGLLPLMVIGAVQPIPIEYELPVPSAQVKSAILLGGLNAPGATTVIEREPTRDHTELMLRHFGATVRVEDASGLGSRKPLFAGRRAITVTGLPELTARPVTVPGDPSSAAFPAVAALIIPDSRVTIRNVGLNPLRAGLYTTLAEMGAEIEIANRREEAGELVSDLTVRASALHAIDVPPERAPTMIDEYPILAVAAAFASGRSRFRGLAELRVKESDRLSAIAAGLRACGIDAAVEGDDLLVEGDPGKARGGATVPVNLDHRIAMSFLVFGLAAAEPVAVDDGGPIATSFPGFVPLMSGLGAAIAPP